MSKTVFALLVLTALAFGCGKSEQTYKTPAGDVKVKEGSGEVTVETATKEGEKLTVRSGDKGVALPADFPKDIPIVKGATVTVAMTQGKQMLVHLSAPGSVTEAAKFYNDALKAQGWEIESTMNMGDDMTMLSAKKGNSKCSVAATKDENRTLVQLTVSPEGS